MSFNETVAQDNRMPRSVRFFRNTCPHCNNDVGIPLLGDFAYGEFIYQTDDGRSYAYVSAIDHPAWVRMNAIFKGAAGMSLDQNNDDIRIYQIVLIRCADLHEGRRYSTNFPLCSMCGGKIKCYSDDVIMFDAEVQDATWNEFLSTSDADQYRKVLALIVEQQRG